MTYDDRRLAAIYDADNPAGPDHAYFRAVADRMHPTRIVDLGCGTGLLTVTLTGPDRDIVGIDPAQAMLDRAAIRPGGDLVGWRLGTSQRIDIGSADLLLMSSNVAMHIIGGAWAATLSDIARGLRPGGVLVFDTPNPEAEAWRNWNQPASQPASHRTEHGPRQTQGSHPGHTTRPRWRRADVLPQRLPHRWRGP